jgi:hypothetical protein
VAGAHGYEVQVCAPNGNWVLAGSFPSTRDLVVSGLVSGTNYQIRVRAVAGAGNYGEWSDVATHVCT